MHRSGLCNKTLAWAMKNPTEPVIVSPSDAPVYDCMQDEVDLTVLPIPHHWPQDRGRYMSASVIIAEVDGRRNMSFHRQFLRDESHLVVRLVPRHLRTMVDEARSKGHEVKIAIVNAPDPVVLLAGAMSFLCDYLTGSHYFFLLLPQLAAPFLRHCTNAPLA